MHTYMLLGVCMKPKYTWSLPKECPPHVGFPWTNFSSLLGISSASFPRLVSLPSSNDPPPIASFIGVHGHPLILVKRATSV